MKHPEPVSEVNWESFFATDMTTQEANVMEQLFGTGSFMTETDPDHNLDMMSSSMYWTNLPPSYESYEICTADGNSGLRSNAASQLRNAGSFSIEPDCFIKGTGNACPDESNMNSSEKFSFSRHHKADPLSKRKLEILKPKGSEVNGNSNEGITEKKPRASKNVQKNKKNAQQKKTKKSYESEDNGGAMNKQTSISCRSEEEESCETQEKNGDGECFIKKSSKSRAERGSATDPQSLYARKRRERINERLKILQNLVPNGTKVDISTMLEEAVQYVKFLQLQIKLLSSEDLWMYAPIAYNGMNIGLDLKQLRFSHCQ